MVKVKLTRRSTNRKTADSYKRQKLQPVLATGIRVLEGFNSNRILLEKKQESVFHETLLVWSNLYLI